MKVINKKEAVKLQHKLIGSIPKKNTYAGVRKPLKKK
jgi:hypothetical protein